VAFSPAGSPFWVNDNGTGCSTLYSGVGTKLTLQVSIPLPGNVVPAASCHPVDPNNPPNPAPAAPTGIVWNPSGAFLVPGTKAAGGRRCSSSPPRMAPFLFCVGRGFETRPKMR